MLIRNSTADMIFQTLERMSHGWCDPSVKSSTKKDKKERRSITAVLATIFAFGSLIIGPAIASILIEISHNTKWRITQLKREMETTHILAELEKRISANAKVEEILASIFLHESIMRDLIHSSDNTEINRTWKRILKHQILEYEKLGLIKKDDEEVLGSHENLLPKNTYKITASVQKNKDCGKTRITIKAVGLIPDAKCLELHENQNKGGDYVKLKTSIRDICVFASKDKVMLADNTTFYTSNTVLGPCNNTDSFEFKSKENTILVRTTKDRGYMSSTCKNKQRWKRTKTILYRDRFYALPIHCTSWVSNDKKRTWDPMTDYQQLEDTFLSATNGQEIRAEKTSPTLLFYAIEEVKDLKTQDDSITKEKEHYSMDFLDSFSFLNPELDKMDNMNKMKTKIIAVLATAVVITVVIVIICRTKKTIKACGNLVLKNMQRNDNGKKDETDNKTRAAEDEFVRLLYINNGEDNNKEQNGKMEEMENKEAEAKGAQYRRVIIHEEPKSRNRTEETNLETVSERIDKVETYYDVPRKLYGAENETGLRITNKQRDSFEIEVQEYMDDIAVIIKKPELPTKMRTKITDTLEIKRTEHDEEVSAPKGKKRKMLGKLESGTEAERYEQQQDEEKEDGDEGKNVEAEAEKEEESKVRGGGEEKEEVKETDKVEGGGEEVDEAEDEGEKEEGKGEDDNTYETIPDWSEEEMAMETFYETITCREGETGCDRKEEDMKEDTESTKLQVELDNQKISHNQSVLHRQMMAELHAQFLAMTQRHKIELP